MRSRRGTQKARRNVPHGRTLTLFVARGEDQLLLELLRGQLGFRRTWRISRPRCATSTQTPTATETRTEIARCQIAHNDGALVFFSSGLH